MFYFWKKCAWFTWIETEESWNEREKEKKDAKRKQRSQNRRIDVVDELFKVFYFYSSSFKILLRTCYVYCLLSKYTKNRFMRKNFSVCVFLFIHQHIHFEGLGAVYKCIYLTYFLCNMKCRFNIEIVVGFFSPAIRLDLFQREFLFIKTKVMMLI